MSTSADTRECASSENRLDDVPRRNKEDGRVAEKVRAACTLQTNKVGGGCVVSYISHRVGPERPPTATIVFHHGPSSSLKAFPVKADLPLRHGGVRHCSCHAVGFDVLSLWQKRRLVWHLIHLVCNNRTHTLSTRAMILQHTA